MNKYGVDNICSIHLEQILIIYYQFKLIKYFRIQIMVHYIHERMYLSIRSGKQVALQFHLTQLNLINSTTTCRI